MALSMAWVILAAAALPPQGYVDVEALLRRQPEWARVQRLQAEAKRLRARAEALPAVAVPPPPPVRSEGAGPVWEAGGEVFAARAAEVELDLLHQAMLAQIEQNRRRSLADAAKELDRDYLTYLRDGKLEWRQWERALALAQRYERINIELRLRQDDVSATEADDLRQRRAVLDAVSDAVGGARRIELARAVTRHTRQTAASFNDALDRAGREEERSADRLLARREAELQDEADAREQQRREGAEQVGDVQVALQLDDWRARLRELPQEYQDRRAAQRERWLTAAAALDERAKALHDELDSVLRPQLLAWLKVLERLAGVSLSTAPGDGRPDVTAQVAERLAALRDDPAALGPEGEVPWPSD